MCALLSLCWHPGGLSSGRSWRRCFIVVVQEVVVVVQVVVIRQVEVSVESFVYLGSWRGRGLGGGLEHVWREGGGLGSKLGPSTGLLHRGSVKESLLRELGRDERLLRAGLLQEESSLVVRSITAIERPGGAVSL